MNMVGLVSDKSSIKIERRLELRFKPFNSFELFKSRKQ